jgi:hypothetical protein
MERWFAPQLLACLFVKALALGLAATALVSN